MELVFYILIVMIPDCNVVKLAIVDVANKALLESKNTNFICIFFLGGK